MYQHIMVPLDGSELAECVLAHVESLALGCSVSRVTLVRVVTPLHLHGGVESRFSPEERKHLEEDSVNVAREYLDKLVKELKEKGAISDVLYRQADQVRLWGNMVGHEDISEAITKEDCEQLLTYLEALLDAVYVQPIRLSALTHKRGQLKKNDGSEKD